MRTADRATPRAFAVQLAELQQEESLAAHRLLLDPLAPLLADVERSVRAQGLAPLPRAEGAAYVRVDATRRAGVAPAPRLDCRG
ncbi:MAG: hypothetical protein MUF00_01115 [Gemmatimonadaceae bacterium]|jgi:hypothetical protein|nr:hypothetical protein [Gemmatimonadaceae bacterium]